MDLATQTLEQWLLRYSGGMPIESILLWPPDTFAITTHLLSARGAYLHAIQTGQTWPTRSDWTAHLDREAMTWFCHILGRNGMPAICQDWYTEDYLHYRHLPVDAYLDLIAPNETDESPAQPTPKPHGAEAVNRLLSLHVLADQASEDFGIPAGADVSSDRQYHNEVAAIQFLGNYLLAKSGSLSRLPQHTVKVLPKLRTPASGMTIRALSHFLTAHRSEIDVEWRTMPLANIDEDTLNVLIVPWPNNIAPQDFGISKHAIDRSNQDASRYFVFRGPENHPFQPEWLREMIDQARKSVSRVHMIIFPELALSAEQHKEVLQALSSSADGANRNASQFVPIVIAGVKTDGEDYAPHLSRNEVIMSTFFTGKWYQFKQGKHHRWRLDERQIRQYQIGGVLPAPNSWWEATRLYRRRLSVLAPNDWLALVPLICEDLARQEPVSELIRGIGPTLLVALLLDGPQLPNRWPGRYASVLADDPGSSVLTVSAQGMVNRTIASLRKGEPASRAIGLWKDMLDGWREIECEDDERPSADAAPRGVVLTITAKWTRETTADGRSDNINGGVFVVEALHQVKASTAVQPPADAGKKSGGGKKDRTEFVAATPNDIAEINLFTYFTDAALELDPKWIDQIFQWVRIEQRDADAPLMDMTGPSASIPTFQSILTAIKKIERKESRNSDNINAQFKPVHHELIHYLSWFSGVLKYLNADRSVDEKVDNLEYYRWVVDHVKLILRAVKAADFLTEFSQGRPFAGLEHTTRGGADKGWIDTLHAFHDDTPASECVRICIYGSHAILWAVHYRLSALRRDGLQMRAGALLLKNIEEEWLAPPLHHKWHDARNMRSLQKVKWRTLRRRAARLR